MLRRILNLAPEAAVAAPPAPAAPVLPAPSPSGDLSAAPNNDIFDDPDFKELETPKTPEPKAKEEPKDKKPDAQKPPDKPQDKKPEVKTPDKPADKKPEEPLADKTVVESKGMKQLRERGDKAVAEVATLKEQLAARDLKLTEYEKKGKDSEAITKRVADLEKQLEERDRKLYALNVAESKEFQEKHVKPYNDAAEDAKGQIERMEIMVKDADGNVTATRPASWENDFAQIFHLNKSSVTKANQKAREIFGEDAGAVMSMVHDLHRLDRNRAKALTDLQANADATRQKEIADANASREWASKAWREINTDLAEKNPEYFQPDPKDTHRAKLFTESLAKVDTALHSNTLTPVQKVTADAQIRLRAAAFPVLNHDNAKLKDRITELEAEIAELRGSAPGDVQHPTGDAAPAPEKDLAQELKEADFG